ncbi:MAG: phosphate signaling complex protein PhoU [Rhodospirillales bacterium]|nr:phosphate signaling complex protein PhoU [Rhodospirillales bacterium]
MNQSNHIVKSYDEDIENITNRIVEMGGLVESQLSDALEAIVKRDALLGQQTAAKDGRIDAMEREIDDIVVTVIARRQPMADDLRAMISALKIVGILERVGDYAAHMAQRAVTVTQGPSMPPILVISRMGKMVRDLLSDALGSYAQRDADLALSVWRRDQDLDQLYGSLFRELLDYMVEDSENIVTCVDLLFIAKYIERIGDFATNIAEHVHFVVRGKMPEGERPKAGGSDYTASN